MSFENFFRALKESVIQSLKKAVKSHNQAAHNSSQEEPNYTSHTDLHSFRLLNSTVPRSSIFETLNDNDLPTTASLQMQSTIVSYQDSSSDNGEEEGEEEEEYDYGDSQRTSSDYHYRISKYHDWKTLRLAFHHRGKLLANRANRCSSAELLGKQLDDRFSLNSNDATYPLFAPATNEPSFLTTPLTSAALTATLNADATCYLCEHNYSPYHLCHYHHRSSHQNHSPNENSTDQSSAMDVGNARDVEQVVNVAYPLNDYAYMFNSAFKNYRKCPPTLQINKRYTKFKHLERQAIMDAVLLLEEFEVIFDIMCPAKQVLENCFSENGMVNDRGLLTQNININGTDVFVEPRYVDAQGKRDVIKSIKIEEISPNNNDDGSVFPNDFFATKIHSRSKAEDLISVNGADKCSICMEYFDKNNRVRKLPCGHIYHFKCIDNWLFRSFEEDDIYYTADFEGMNLLNQHDDHEEVVYVNRSGASVRLRDMVGYSEVKLKWMMRKVISMYTCPYCKLNVYHWFYDEYYMPNFVEDAKEVECVKQNSGLMEQLAATEVAYERLCLEKIIRAPLSVRY